MSFSQKQKTFVILSRVHKEYVFETKLPEDPEDPEDSNRRSVLAEPWHSDRVNICVLEGIQKSRLRYRTQAESFQKYRLPCIFIGELPKVVYLEEGFVNIYPGCLLQEQRNLQRKPQLSRFIVR